MSSYSRMKNLFQLSYNFILVFAGFARSLDCQEDPEFLFHAFSIQLENSSQL